MASEKWMTPPQVAARLGVTKVTVLSLIRVGELEATNIAVRLTSQPRWKIHVSAVEAFEKRRNSRNVFKKTK